ncbi:MAG: chromate efflux transporter [Clostridia bacterium]
MEDATSLSKQQPGKTSRLFEILAVSTKLGLTSFGGPIAHLGYFHNEYIRKRRWMDERSYAELVALCQFLPGPASSQVGIGIGMVRGGLLGGLLAWIGFTLPSVLVLLLFAFLLQGMDASQAGWVHGLKIVAVAIVAQAVLGMGQKLAADKSRATIAVASLVITLIWQHAFSQVILIAAAGVLGAILYRNGSHEDVPGFQVPVGKKTAVICLMLFFGLLFALPLIRQAVPSLTISLLDSFYRSGALVFGGGHVVLPLLEKEVVPTGWMSKADFLVGYGATQAVPGPLFTFASYLGAMIAGVPGALIATVGIFLPAFLLVIGALPFWHELRQHAWIQGALKSINAAVVGILLAALYHPLWTSAILTAVDFALVSVLFVLLVFWKTPPWLVVLAGALAGSILQFL